MDTMHNVLDKIDSALDIIGGLLILSSLIFIGYAIVVVASK